MKASEDPFFRFVLTWVERASDKGWTTHYRAKHMPLSSEFQSALDFLGGFFLFRECPEFAFETCWWRFTPYTTRERDVFDGNAEHAHRCFDAHKDHFSLGLKQLLAAHSEVSVYGLSFLTHPTANAPVIVPPRDHSAAPPPLTGQPLRFDVAFSFARTERSLAEELARRVRDAGFEVFYDGFYPEQLWGRPKR